ncbi:hypothetical protein ANN_18707 [Periplaneta americana]|uniref:RNase H type-1 domain-containing protein n=1 Tax=Periplaneta americana TaxID=6978 RepID=A0ABQ8SRL9_PERAM|nr:hypothetical protein ANN_18707 [Periplaneta americana]
MRQTAIHLQLDGHRIPTATSVKFLGVTIQQNTSFSTHVHNTINKAQNILKLFKAMAARSWGADSLILLKLIHPLLLTKIEYGILMAPPLPNNSRHKINSAIYQIYKIIFNINGHPAIKTLQTYLPYFQTEERQQRLGIRFIQKLFTHASNILLPKLQRLSELQQTCTNPNLKPKLILLDCYNRLSTYTHIYKTPVLPNYLMDPYYPTIDFPVNIDTTTFQKQTINIQSQWMEYVASLQQKHPNYTLQLLFTDGSRKETGVGAGFYNWNTDTHKTWRLHPQTSIYTAETIALYMALKEIKTLGDLPTAIFTDSLSVIQATQKAYNTPQQIYEILVKGMLRRM